jgi:peroxiredoxin
MAGLSLGDDAPPFELPATDGKKYALGEPSMDVQATVVYWTCNHCPYALAWHGRLADVAGEYAARGVHTVFVNPNDAERYPADSLEAMRRRVDEESWTAPYLHDEDQQVAREFGARVTPDVFVVDSELRVRYRGAPDQDYEDPAANALWLREAIDDVLSGVELGRPETEPVGCSIKWRP